MLKNNIMYMILSVMLCIVALSSELVKLYNIDILYRVGYGFIAILFGRWIYRIFQPLQQDSDYIFRQY